MTTTYIPHPNLTSRKKAFTMVELIIVIVVLAVLASIAIAGYRTVVDRTYDSKALTTVTTATHEAFMLAKFRSDDTFTDADMTTAMADVGAAAGAPSGVLAASGNGWDLAKAGPVPCADPDAIATLSNGLRPYASNCFDSAAKADVHTVSYAISEDHQHLAAAVKSETGAIMYARIDNHGNQETGAGSGTGGPGDDTAIPALYSTWFTPGAWANGATTTTAPVTTTTTADPGCATTAPAPVGVLFSPGGLSNSGGSGTTATFPGMAVDSPVVDLGGCRWVVITGITAWGTNDYAGNGTLQLEAMAYGTWDGSTSVSFAERTDGSTGPTPGTAIPGTPPEGGGAFNLSVAGGSWQQTPSQWWPLLAELNGDQMTAVPAGNVIWSAPSPTHYTAGWDAYSAGIGSLASTPFAISYGASGSVTVAGDSSAAPTGFFAASDPAPLGGQPNGFLTVGMASGANTGAANSVTITFDAPVTNLTFDMLGIDNNSTGGPWQDKVSVSARNAGAAVQPGTVSNDTGVAQSFDGVTETLVNNSPDAVGDNATDGNVTFLYDQPVTSITITLAAGPDVATPIEQRVGVSSLAFDSFYR